jgi:hypothetical protein
MASSGMLRRVPLVRTEVLEELSASFIRVTRIVELGTTLVLSSNRRTLRRNTMYIVYSILYCYGILLYSIFKSELLGFRALSIVRDTRNHNDSETVSLFALRLAEGDVYTAAPVRESTE